MGLESSIPGTTLSISGSFHRPPMERTSEIEKLAQNLIAWAKEMNFDLSEEATGGGSDTNLTAAMGVPSADGLGAKGQNPHAERENIM